MVTKTTKFALALAEAKCIPPDVDGLTPVQQNALHAFKFEVLAALHRLYMTVPKELADPIIDKYLPGPPSAS